MTDVLAIVNSTADSDILSTLREGARARGIRVEMTRKPGDARRLAAQGEKEGAAIVVAAGGDGTIHEVVSGLMEDGPPRAALGVVPLGTGNDFARNLGLPEEPLEALDVVTRPGLLIDVVALEADGRREIMLNAMNGGFSGLIGEEIDAETKDRWGRLSYLKAASESLANLQKFRVILRVEDPDQLTFSAYNLAIANCPRVGGGFPIAPEADPTDGLADVVIVRPAPMAKLVTLLPSVLRGDEPESALFQSWKVSQGEVLTDPVLPYSLDGEPTQASRFHFQVIPGALEVRGARWPAE